MILRNYSKIIKKTKKEKKMITDHNFDCRGCLKFNTKKDIQFVFVNTELIGTFEGVSATFEKYLQSMFNSMIDNFDLVEPKVKNAMYEITSIKEENK